VKITPLNNEAVNFLNIVREKKDNGSGQFQNPQQQKKDPDSDAKNAEPDTNPPTVGAAISQFHTEMDAQANGLNANMTGKGPGLRVVLTDSTGNVVRQFTGEEFLKLREAATQGTGKRGRILDQKF
jgi:hypothetical protein